jgi:hypothetical protein
MLHALSEALFIIIIVVLIVKIAVIYNSTMLIIDVFSECLLNIVLLSN